MTDREIESEIESPIQDDVIADNQAIAEKKTNQWWRGLTFSSIVRIAGAALLVVSASSFMIEKVSHSNDVVRYFALLGHTVFLGAAGIFCALKLKESRSARTFFAIVVASVPVHFAALGGMIYSAVQWDAGFGSQQPQLWMAGSLLQALGLLGIGMLVLFPLMLFGMMTLARKHAKSLTGAFFLMNALLLVPVRHPEAIALVFSAGAAILYWMEHRYFSRKTSLKTAEGRIMRTVLALPPVIALGRTLLFYDGTLLLWISVSTVLLGLLYLGVRRNTSHGAKLQNAIAPFLSLSGIILLALVVEALGLRAHLDSWEFSLFCLFAFGWIALLGTCHVTNGFGYYRVALIGFAAMSLLQMTFFPSVFTTAVALAGASASLIASVLMQQRITLLLSLAALVTCIGYHLQGVFYVTTMSHWGVLLGAGAILLVGASLIDRHKALLAKRMRHFKTAYRSWGY